MTANHAWDGEPGTCICSFDREALTFAETLDCPLPWEWLPDLGAR
jgi:hypothetical protein